MAGWPYTRSISINNSTPAHHPVAASQWPWGPARDTACMLTTYPLAAQLHSPAASLLPPCAPRHANLATVANCCAALLVSALYPVPSQTPSTVCCGFAMLPGPAGQHKAWQHAVNAVQHHVVNKQPWPTTACQELRVSASRHTAESLSLKTHMLHVQIVSYDSILSCAWYNHFSPKQPANPWRPNCTHLFVSRILLGQQL